MLIYLIVFVSSLWQIMWLNLYYIDVKNVTAVFNAAILK